jgi:hypothetical protein
VAQEDVRGFEVQVQDPGAVGGVDGVADLPEGPALLRGGKPAAGRVQAGPSINSITMRRTLPWRSVW